MDTDEFLQRCEQIEKGLHRLADDLYAVVDEGVSGAEKDDLVGRAKEKVRIFDALLAALDDEDTREEAEGRLKMYIDSLREDLRKLDDANP